jgi:glycosyltransferase involved in cell wall biosynthesis
LKFLGEVTGRQKVDLFHKHDVFVFTPIAPEGLPWVILEAMSASLPVVTTAQGAIAEVVNHEDTGLIVSPTPEQVAEGICKLLQDPATARAMGERGRRRVEEHFSEQVYLSKLIELFHQVAPKEKGKLRTVSEEKATIAVP